MPDLKDTQFPVTLLTTAQRRRRTETREELLSRLLDPILTLEETAVMLDVCPATVRRYTNRGILPHERSQGNQRRFRLSCVLAFMESRHTGGHGALAIVTRRRATLTAESDVRQKMIRYSLKEEQANNAG